MLIIIYSFCRKLFTIVLLLIERKKETTSLFSNTVVINGVLFYFHSIKIIFQVSCKNVAMQCGMGSTKMHIHLIISTKKSKHTHKIKQHVRKNLLQENTLLQEKF